MNNRERQTTLDGIQDKITCGRKDGNSTRCIDNAIQIIFSGKICVVLDHCQMGANRKLNRILFDKVIRRLEVEHRWVVESMLVVDKKKLEIYITNPKAQIVPIMTNEQIKNECELQYFGIRQAEEIIKEIRNICKHEKTFEGDWSFGIGGVLPAVICIDCGELVEVKCNKQ